DAALFRRKIAERLHLGEDRAFFTCGHALPDPAVAQHLRVGVGLDRLKLALEIFPQFGDSIRHMSASNLKTQDSGNGLRESWVGNFRILPEQNQTAALPDSNAFLAEPTSSAKACG